MHALNVQQACWAVKLSRATYYYQSKAKDDQAIIERIQTHITQNPRHGFDKLYDTLPLTGAPPCGKTHARRCQVFDYYIALFFFNSPYSPFILKNIIVKDTYTCAKVG